MTAPQVVTAVVTRLTPRFTATLANSGPPGPPGPPGLGVRDASQFLASKTISGTYTIETDDGTLICVGATVVDLPPVATIDPDAVGGHEYTLFVAGFFGVSIDPAPGVSLYGPDGQSITSYEAPNACIIRLLQTQFGWNVTYDSSMLGGGGGDVYLDAENFFTQPQRIDVTIPVVDIADIGTTKPVILLHLHDQGGALIEHFASSVDVGGGVLIRTAGTFTSQVGTDGVPTDKYLMEYYTYMDGLTPMWRRGFSEITSTDPGTTPWLSDMFAAVSAPIRVGEPVDIGDATTKLYVDTEVALAAASAIKVGDVAPAEPDDPASTAWIRTQGNLRTFVDFRLMPNGQIPNTTNGSGAEDPADLVSFHSTGAPFQPCFVIDGAVQSDMVTPSAPGQPSPKTGFGLFVAPGASGRIDWQSGGVYVGNGEMVDYSPTNIAISDAVGNAYLMGVVIGRFDPGLDTTAPSNPVSARMRLILDVLAAPSTLASAALPELPQPGDVYSFTYDAATGALAGHLNGTEIVSVVDLTHDITTFDSIGMPLHVGSDVTEWNDGYYQRVEWLSLSVGTINTGRTGVHTWTPDGWRPVYDQADLVLPDAEGFDVPVTLFADIATTRPQWFQSSFDHDKRIAGTMAGKIDFGGGVIMSVAARANRASTLDGAWGDKWILTSANTVDGLSWTGAAMLITALDNPDEPTLSDLFGATILNLTSGTPTQDGEVATKGYVDGAIPSVPALSSSAATDLGTPAAGSTGEASDAGHVHQMPSASDVGAAEAAHNHDGIYEPLGGADHNVFGTASEVAMLALDANRADFCIRSDQNNNLWMLVGGDPTLITDWRIVQYGTTDPSTATRSTAPSTPANGDMWFDTDTGKTYCWVDSESAWIEVGSSLVDYPPVATAAVDLTLDATHEIVRCTVAGITITLPTAVGIAGRMYWIDNDSPGPVTIDGNGSETIQGLAAQSLPADSALTVYSTGSNWRIV